MAGKQNMINLLRFGASSSQNTPSASRHHGTHAGQSPVGPYPSRTGSVPLTPGERTALRREQRKAKTPAPGAGSSCNTPSGPMSPDSDKKQSDEGESSDSETVRKTLRYVPSEHPVETPPNVPIDTSAYDTDSPMRPPSHPEEPPTTTSVASQPNTVNQSASAALQRLHDYIDSQLNNLVGAAVEQAVGDRYNQLADTINEEIVSIRNQVLRDEDDPMRPQDQPIDNSADAGDEFEEDSRTTYHRDRQNGRQAANTKGKNNHYNHQQTADDDEDDGDDEDENDNNANHGRRRKAPIVLTFALRAFLQRKGLMVKEVSGLPKEPLPPCAPAHEVQHYNNGISRTGPDLYNIQYFWPGALAKCKWNKQATAHLANEYHNLFQEGKILHNGRVLPYDSTIHTKDIEKKIRIRLQRTQMHWKNANRPQNSPLNTDVPAIPLSAPWELASLRMKESRFRRRGAKLLEKRKKVAERHISDQQLKKQVFDMLESLGNGGMNSPLSDSEDSLDKELQRCEHFWLSPEILSLFEALDLIDRRAQNSRLITRKGNRPLRINNKPPKRVLDSAVTPLLPKNWYREEWYNHLDLYQKTDLNAAKIKALPDIQKIREMVEG